MFRLLAPLALTLLFAMPIMAQYGGVPDSGYTFAQAKQHNHQTILTLNTIWCGRGLIVDPTNTTGNQFYGNTNCVEIWDNIWMWYDWGADPDASEKLAILNGTGVGYAWITVKYDPYCRTVTELIPQNWPAH